MFVDSDLSVLSFKVVCYFLWVALCL